MYSEIHMSRVWLSRIHDWTVWTAVIIANIIALGETCFLCTVDTTYFNYNCYFKSPQNFKIEMMFSNK